MLCSIFHCAEKKIETEKKPFLWSNWNDEDEDKFQAIFAMHTRQSGPFPEILFGTIGLSATRAARPLYLYVIHACLR